MRFSYLLVLALAIAGAFVLSTKTAEAQLVDVDDIVNVQQFGFPGFRGGRGGFGFGFGGRRGGFGFGGRRGGGFFGRDEGRFGDRRGDRFGDRFGDRRGDRFGDRFGDRRGDRFDDRRGDRFDDRRGDRFDDRRGERFERDDMGADVLALAQLQNIIPQSFDNILPQTFDNIVPQTDINTAALLAQLNVQDRLPNNVNDFASLAELSASPRSLSTLNQNEILNALRQVSATNALPVDDDQEWKIASLW